MAPVQRPHVVMGLSALSAAKVRLSVRFSPMSRRPAGAPGETSPSSFKRERRPSVDSAAAESFSASQQSSEILAAIKSLAADMQVVRTAVDALRGEGRTPDKLRWRSPAAPPVSEL